MVPDVAAPKFLTTADVAQEFMVSHATVTRWAKDGRLEAIRTPGGAYRFKRADVQAFLKKSAADEPVAS